MKKFNMLFLGAWLSLFVSCKIGEKAVSKYKASDEFAADCSLRFPPPPPEYIKGKDSIIEHETYIDCDSAIASYEGYWRAKLSVKDDDKTETPPPAKTNKVPCKCPPSTHRVDTLKLLDGKREAALITQIKRAQASEDKEKDRADNEAAKKKMWRKIAFVTGGIGLALLAALIFLISHKRRQ